MDSGPLPVRFNQGRSLGSSGGKLDEKCSLFWTSGKHFVISASKVMHGSVLLFLPNRRQNNWKPIHLSFRLRVTMEAIGQFG